MAEVKWFGMIYSREGMLKNPEKMKQVTEWKPPTDKNGVKCFLQTILHSIVHMSMSQRNFRPSVKYFSWRFVRPDIKTMEFSYLF